MAQKSQKEKNWKKIIKNVYSKYFHVNALEYMTGYIGGFSKSNMASINELWGKRTPATT